MKVPSEIAGSGKQRSIQYLFLFLSALFIRLPFFTKDYIDRDESTFILMGQSVADGFLPYVHLWDLKPPLLFFIYGLIEWIFPDSLVAIRLAGVLVVFISAVLIMKISGRSGLKQGFLAGLAYILFSSEFGNLQCMMSEHLAVVFFLAGMLFFLKSQKTDLLIAGFFLGCALLCKISMAYAAVALFLVHLWQNRTKPHIETGFMHLVFTGLGLLIPFFMIAVPYLWQDQGQLFVDSVFRAPLEYGNNAGMNIGEKLKITWWIILAGAAFILFAFYRRKNLDNRSILYYSVTVIAATIYTFFSSGVVNGHYLVLIYPFIFLLLFDLLLKKILFIRPALLAIIVVGVSVESLLEYARVIQSFRKNGHPWYSTGFVATKKIRQKGLEKEKIYFLDYHIGYWLLNQYPLTKSTTHPSNLKRDFLFKYSGGRANTMEELRYIMDTVKPAVVVSKFPTIGFLANEPVPRQYFDSLITSRYEVMHAEPGRLYIWKLK